MMMPTKSTVTEPEGEDERSDCCTFPTFDYIIGPIKVSSLSLFTYKKGPRHNCHALNLPFLWFPEYVGMKWIFSNGTKTKYI